MMRLSLPCLKSFSIVLTKDEILEAVNEWLVTNPDDRFGDLPDTKEIVVAMNAGELYISWTVDEEQSS